MNIIVSALHIPLRDSFYYLDDIEHIQILQFKKKTQIRNTKETLKLISQTKGDYLGFLRKPACYQPGKPTGNGYISEHIDFDIFSP